MNTRWAALLVMVLLFALGVGAGVVSDRLSARLVTHVPVQPVVDRGTLSDELHLSEGQRAAMQQIWEEVQHSSRESLDQARQIEHEQENALLAMLDDEQKARYAKLTQENKARVTALEAARAAAFKKAVERTEQLLNPEQRASYEQMIRGRIGYSPDAPAGQSNAGLGGGSGAGLAADSLQ